MPTLANGGQIIPSAPEMYSPPIQKLNGSALDVASTNTINAFRSQAEAARALGAGQKGASRRRRRGGAALNLNARIPDLPEAGTISGVSHAQNHLDAVNHLNQIRADKVGDSLINATPIKLGGKKHGRSRKRSHRRGRRRVTRRRRGSRRSV